MPNPYLTDSANAISRNLTQNFQENMLPGINSGAMMAGGFGGSRQGVAQGIGMGRTQQAIGDAQASLYGNAYEGDQNRSMQQSIASMQNDTQRLGMTNSYNLGLGGLGLQDKSLDQNFYNQNRSMDLSQYGLGASLAGQGNLGLSNQGQQLWQNGQQQQQAPWQQLGQFGNLAGQFSGLNQSQSQSQPGASKVGSALGGALTAAQIWALLSGSGG